MKEITIKFYACEKQYTKENAKKFLLSRFAKTNNTKFLDKLKELMNGETTIVLGGI
jgi:hypothetical protein